MPPALADELPDPAYRLVKGEVFLAHAGCMLARHRDDLGKVVLGSEISFDRYKDPAPAIVAGERPNSRGDAAEATRPEQYLQFNTHDV